MPSDTWLMTIIAFTVFFVTSTFWIVYGAYRADQMRQTHQAELDMVREENWTLSKIVKQTEVQARVLGSTPVSRLIGNEDP